MAILDTLKSDVEQAQTVEQGVVTYITGLVDKLRQAFNQDAPAAVEAATAIVNEAETTAGAIGAAVKANT